MLGLSSPREALQLVERELAAHVDHDQVDMLRAEASARLERLLESAWGKAMDPADSEHLPALRVALAILDRHIRLHGADRPTQLEVYTPTAAELERFVAGIVEGTVPEVVEANVVGELETGQLP